MDFVLISPYNHNEDSFGELMDPCLQAETLGLNTWRRLRNSRDLKPERDAKGSDSFAFMVEGGKEYERYNKVSPL